MIKYFAIVSILACTAVTASEKHVFTRDVKGKLKDREHCRPLSNFGFKNKDIRKLCGAKQTEGFYLCNDQGVPYYLFEFSTKADCETAISLLRRYILEIKK